MGQGSIILLGHGHPRNVALNGGIKHRHFNAGIDGFFHQRGRIGVAPLREDNPVIFLADRLINEVLEFGVVAIAQKGADLKAELFALLNGTGDKLRGVVVRAEVTDHRNADGAVMICNGGRKRCGGCRKAWQRRQ